MLYIICAFLSFKLLQLPTGNVTMKNIQYVEFFKNIIQEIGERNKNLYSSPTMNHEGRKFTINKKIFRIQVNAIKRSIIRVVVNLRKMFI